MFSALSLEQLSKVVVLQMSDLAARLRERDITIVLDDTAAKVCCEWDEEVMPLAVSGTPDCCWVLFLCP